MIKIQNSNFQNTRVEIDNIAYSKCEFKNCRVVYSGKGPISLIDCNFVECEWSLDGAAQNTLMFLRTMQSSFGPFGKDMVAQIIKSITDEK